MFSPVHTWRHAKVALELLREMALVGEAGRQGDPSQREVRLLQQRLRALHALAQDKTVGLSPVVRRNRRAK
jgi:hypothetical protein